MKTFNVKLLYAYKFINQCMPIYAFYTVLFIQRGKTLTDVAVLIALWSVFTIVLEVPAGILADRWNRKNMLALATMLQGVCFVIWYFSHTFFMFALGFLFWSIAGAFVSGTEEGLIYDNLKSDGKEELFTKVYGRAQFFANIGIITGIASAGAIVNFVSIPTIALLSAAICFVNVVFALLLREKNFYSEKEKEQSGGYFETLKGAGRFIKDNPLALISILFLVLFASLGHYLNEFDALIIIDWELNYVWVSIVFVVRFAFVAIGDILAPIVQKKISSIKQIFLICGLGCVLLTVFAGIWNHFALVFFGLAFMVITVSEILLVNTLQNEIKEEGRATVMSFYSVGQNLAMICLSLIYAFLAGILTLQQVYIMIGGYGIIGVLVFVLVAKVKKITA